MKDVLTFLLLVFLIVVPIRIFVAQPFIVNGASMDPTFNTGQYLIVDQLSYRFNSPKRGDVVVFRYPNDPNQFFIKRIIGLPGEKLEIQQGSVTVYSKENPSGVKLEEPYIKNNSKNDNLVIALNKDEYYVLGDNRSASSDSRSWGPLSASEIIGRPLFRLIPFRTISIFPGKYKSDYIDPN